MNGQFQVAQASGTGVSNSGAPPRVFKLTKPLTDQAVIINLGYDQKVQVDFSAIANEKITLVHVGEKLIILFDNQSTVTVEPFFDSRHDALQNLTIEIAPGRDLSVTEFASTFPITTDQSVLPAAGNGNGNAQASGAHFDNPAVDPLAVPNPLPLLPQEELGNFVVTNPTGTATDVLPPNPPSPVLPTIVAGLVPGLIVDESFLTAATNGIDGSNQGPAGSTVAGGLAPFTVDAPAGQQSLTFALSVSAQGVDSGLIDSQTGNRVFLFLEGGQVVGREGTDAVAAGAGGQLDRDFTLSVDATGHITLTDLRSVHQGAGEAGDISEGKSPLAGLISLTATVTDINNASASASVDVGSHLSFLDDGPAMAVSVGSDAEVLLTTHDALTIGAASDTATGDFGALFTSLGNYGADGPGTTVASYALNVTLQGENSGLSSHGATIFLYKVGSDIEGSTSATLAGVTAANTVFALSVNGSGVVTLTQNDQIDHPIASDPTPTGAPFADQLAVLGNGLVTLTGSALITDFDGDTANDSKTIDLGGNVQFADDGPSISGIDNGIVSDTPNSVVIGNIVIDSGADGFGAHPASLAGNGDPVGLLFNGQQVHYSVNAAGDFLTAYIGADPTIVANDVFTLGVDANTDHYSFTLLQPFTAIVTDNVGSSSAFGSGPAGEQVLLTDGSGIGVPLTNEAAVISGIKADGTTNGDVNGSTVGWGVGNNNFDVGEKMLFDFTDGASVTPGGGVPTFHPIPNLEIASYTFSGYKGGDDLHYTITYWDGSTLASRTSSSGELDPSAHTTVATEWTTSNFAAIPPGDILYSVSFTDVTGSGKVDLVSVGVFSSVNLSENLSFGVTTTDFDGDTASGNINININGSTTLQGTAANDAIGGGTGNETIVGAAGNDTMSGGGGNDKFVLDGHSSGGVSLSGHDIISDFNAGDLILVDVASQAFTPATSVAISAAQFTSVATDAAQTAAWNGTANQFVFNTANSELFYSANGTAATAIDLAHVSTGISSATAIHTF